jgi:hypothetical protein
MWFAKFLPAARQNKNSPPWSYRQASYQLDTFFAADSTDPGRFYHEIEGKPEGHRKTLKQEP